MGSLRRGKCLHTEKLEHRGRLELRLASRVFPLLAPLRLPALRSLTCLASLAWLASGALAQVPTWDALLQEAALTSRVAVRWSEVLRVAGAGSETDSIALKQAPRVASVSALELGIALTKNRRLLSSCPEVRQTATAALTTSEERETACDLGARALAAYDLHEDRILLADHFQTAALSLARLFGVANEMRSTADRSALLDVVLWHELAHALQHRLFNLPEMGAAARGFEARSAFSAVIEGHAQFLASRLATSERHRAAWALFARQHEELPAGCATNAAHSIAACEASFAYRAGLHFFETLAQVKRSSEVLQLAMQNPPRTLWHVEHPFAWWDGETDPGQRFEPLLRGFARSEFAREDWASALENITRETLARALSALNSQRVAALVASVRGSRVLHVRARQGERRLIFAVLDLGSMAHAQEFLEAEEAASRDFDDLRREDLALRVHYQRTADGLVWIEKTWTHDGEVEERSALLLATLGSLVIELNVIGDTSAERARQLVNELAATLAHEPMRSSTTGK